MSEKWNKWRSSNRDYRRCTVLGYLLTVAMVTICAALIIGLSS